MSAHNHLLQLNNAPCEVLDPGTGVAIVVDRWNQHIPITINGTETNTLANPTQAGQLIAITCVSLVTGTRAITVAGAINQAGNTIITLNTVNDTIILMAVPFGSGTYRWRVVLNDGCSLS